MVWLVLAGLLLMGTASAGLADELGEHILTSILKGEKASDAALLLMTRDLKWYERNMGRLPETLQNRVQQIRVNIAGESAQMAARSLNEAESVFAATGSWKPGRDADILYLGKNGDSAASAIESGFDTVTARILRNAEKDPIIGKFTGDIPKKLSAGSLAVCTTELPDYGYRNLRDAYKKAKDALARGESRDDIVRMFRDEVKNAMTSNVRAHFAAAANPDYYGGASGQEWFRKTYLDDPGRTRVFARNADGQWTLRQGGIQALPDDIVERIGFGGLGGGQVKFTKIASDYSMFFTHMGGGASDNAKYALRVWKDMGLNAIQDLSDEELKVLAAAKAVSNNPSRASQILADLGMGNVDDFNRGIGNMLLRWTESQLMKDMERIVGELGAASARSLDDIERIMREARGSMDLNEVVAGLNKLKSAPDGKVLQARLLDKLKAKFGDSDAGKAALRFVLKNLGLMDEGGELTGRILKMLAKMGRVNKAELEAFESGGELSETLRGRVNRVKKELIALNAGSMVSLDEALDLEGLMEDWRRSQPGAILQSPDDELRKLLKEMREAPDGDLKKIGWLDEEIAIQNKIRAGMSQQEQMVKMKGFCARAQARVAKGGGTLRQLQSKVRDLMFSPAYTKLGDPSMSVGAFDAIVGVASALYQSYDILNGPAMSPEDEALALENAWVTSIPIVGDFAQGLISGGQAYYEGDRSKALDAGLWVTIGIMGCVPGGQLPAVVTGIVMATKPIATAAYEARQAQNLIQAWVESGIWTDTKPKELQGLFDRQGLRHPLTYEWLLTDKANVAYSSTKFGDATINDSIRDYAEKNVMPQFPSVKALRDALKSVYPDFNDKEWDDEFLVKIKIDARGGKGSKILFHSYNRVRTAALNQTISHLKKWAEDELRAAKDYDSEVARLRDELKKMEDELKTTNLVSNADASVEAYSRVIKNVWEQESLPLSKMRIYEHYVKTYSEIAGKLRRVTDLMNEASAPYIPASWHLTGYPEFDKGRISRMLAMMEAGRKGIIEQLEIYLKEMGYEETRYDKNNECHKKFFDLLAPLRYKVAFIENLIEYYRQLAGGTSAWGGAYEAAQRRYAEARDRAARAPDFSVRAAMENAAMQDAFMTFVFSIPYGLASGEAALYSSTARDFELRLIGAQKDFDLAKGKGGTAYRALQSCLVGELRIELQLSNPTPEKDEEVTAVAKVVEGAVHKDMIWDWRFEGGVKKKEVSVDRATFTAAGRGRLVARLYDWWNPSTGKFGKLLKEASVDLAPKDTAQLTLIVSGPLETETGKKVTYYLSVSTTDPAARNLLARSRIQWLVNGYPVGGSDSSLSFSPDAPGVYTVSALAVTDSKAGRKTVGSSSQARLVVTTPKKDDQKKDGQKKPDDGATTGTDVKKQPPSCSYEYSEWGECSRSTKKQTRTVTLRKPAGCVDKYKPALEQGCTPPPTEEDKRNQYFNCLCRCSSGWAGHIGVWYDPEGKSIPECKSSGPCFGGAGAFGCTRRHYFAGPSDCAKGCWEGAFGKGTYDAKKADDLRKKENRKYKKPVTVKIKPSKNPADFGDIIDLQAEAAEGSGGYSYKWGGCAQDAKEAYAKVVNTRECKPCAATVTVTDMDGESASDSVTIKCNTVRVKLTRESPRENSVPVGGKATFLAEVFSGDKPFSGPTLFYLWERNPDAIFGDPKNPQYETSGGSQARHTATFRKSGTTPVWVTVQREMDGRKVTIGESEQIPMAVVNPELTITVTPQKPSIGQEVKLQVQTRPPMGDDIIGFWWDIPGYWSGTGDKASFKPKDSKPVKATVHAKTRDGGDEVGTRDVTITAQAYDVAISEPRYLESPPQIWKCDTQLGQAQKCGMVTVKPNEFVVFRDIFLKAGVTPQPESPRYRWTVDPSGSCGMPGSGSELRLNCGSTGTYTVKLEVTNAEGAKLGEATQTVTISISKDALEGSQKARQAAEKLAKAKQMVAQGNLDEGIALAGEAATLDPKSTEAASLFRKWAAERDKVRRHVDACRKSIESNRLPDARKELDAATKLHGKYRPVVEAADLLKKKQEEQGKKKEQLAQKLATARQLARQGKLDEAIAVAGEAAKEDAALAAPVLAEIGLAARKSGWDALQKADYQTAIKRLEQAVKLNPADSDAVKKLSEAKNYGAQWPRIEAKAKEFDGFMAQKKVWSAHKAMLELQDILRPMAAGQSSANPVWKRVSDEMNKGIAWYNEFSQKSFAEWTRLFKAQEWEQAEKHLKQVMGQELSPADVKQYTSSLQLVNSMLAQRQEAMQYYEGARANFAKGIPADAKGLGAVARELKNRAARFKQGDARRAQLEELASAMEKGQKGRNAREYARTFFANGDRYYREYNFEAAMAQYGEGLKAIKENGDISDPDYARYYKLREDAAAKDKRFKELYAYAAGLAATDKPLDEETIKKGIAASEEALKIRPRNGDMEIHWNKLKWKLGELQRVKSQQQDAARRCEAKWADGQALYNAGKQAEALGKFRENIACAPGNREREAYVRKLVDALNKQAAAKQACAELRRQGDALVTRKQYAEGIARYRESLRCQPDEKLEEYIRRIEAEMKKQEEVRSKTARAQQLRAEGEQLQNRKRYQEAMDRYRQSLSLVPDKALADHVARMERELARKDEQKAVADRLWSEGTASLKASRPEEALSRFKESVRTWPDQTRSAYVADLEGRKAAAQRLRNDGAALQRQNRPAEAISRYRESLGYWPDTALDSHIARLEAAAKKAAVRAPVTPVTQAPVVAGKGKVILDTGNTGGVYNNPGKPATFTISTPHVITLIQDYHWNNARGSRAGTIALRSSGGATYGPWQTKGTPGQGGVPNAYWTCHPNVTIPAGTYTVVDSEPSTWAQNSQSGGRGFSRVEGYPAGSAPSSAGRVSAPVPATRNQVSSVTAELKNASRENVHIFTEGESFSPANRLAPGEKRKVTVRLSGDDGVTFKAGRSGKVLATARWQGAGGQAGRVPVVSFDDSNPFGMLSVTTGLR
jgi:tetratricopeptide (TPR) repeat protein